MIDDSAMIGTRGGARILADRLGELVAVHARHLDVGDDHVDRAAVAQARQRVLGAGDRGHVVAGRLQHRGEHVAEERRVVDEQQRARLDGDVHVLALSQSSKASGR